MSNNNHWIGLVVLSLLSIAKFSPIIAQDGPDVQVRKVAIMLDGHLHIVRTAPPFLLGYAAEGMDSPKITMLPNVTANGDQPATILDYEVSKTSLMILQKTKQYPPDLRPVVTAFSIESGLDATVMEQNIGGRLLRTLDNSSSIINHGKSIYAVMGIPINAEWSHASLYSDKIGSNVFVALSIGNKIITITSPELAASKKGMNEGLGRGVLGTIDETVTIDWDKDKITSIDGLFPGSERPCAFVISGDWIRPMLSKDSGIKLPIGGLRLIFDKDTNMSWIVGGKAKETLHLQQADVALVSRLDRLEQALGDSIAKIQDQLGYKRKR